ncbi:MAG: prevent-host-death protein [Gammaproteobacteria bacterium]|nr:MAG: prevent-host-death protein [Gammaproteobacteria bacterium]
MTTSVTSTEFQTRSGKYLEASGKHPVLITRHDRPYRILIDVGEYQRLKALDTRQALYPHELSEELKQELEKGYQGKPTPDLDHLMD